MAARTRSLYKRDKTSFLTGEPVLVEAPSPMTAEPKQTADPPAFPTDSLAVPSQGWREAFYAQAQAEAAAVLERAKTAAVRLEQETLARLEQEAQATRERSREEGYASGRAEGLTRGREEGLAQVRDLLRQAQIVLAQALAEKEAILAHAEPEMLALVLAVASRVIGREVSLDHNLVLEAIRKALKHVRGQERVVIKVNLEELELARSARTQLLQTVDGVREIEIVEDPQVEPGGCIIETTFGTIDARIGTQLEEIAAALARK